MTGCSAVDRPEGDDELYAAGSAHYTEFATGLHDVLMSVHEGEWAVSQGDHGAAPITCDGGDGFSFHAIRQVTIDGMDADGVVTSAVEALETLGLEVTSGSFGDGADEQRSVTGTGGTYENVAITIRPATEIVLVTASSTCVPGNAHDLGNLVFDGSTAPDQWRLLPAFEGPDTRVQFFFPEDGPVYYNEDATPVTPQPVVTEVPVAPYGG